MKSVIQKNRECIVCKTKDNLHLHHIMFGSSNRKHSDELGYTCYLCYKHHNGSNEGVHFNKKLDLQLKNMCQRHWIMSGKTVPEWRRIFGKWWDCDVIEIPKIFD